MHRAWSWFVQGGTPDGANTSDLRQVRFVNIFSLIGIITLAVFGLVHVVTDDQVMVGAAELAAAVALTINVILLRVRRSAVLASRVLLGVNFLVLILLMFTGGIARTGAFWLFTHLPTAYFLRGWREGSVWAGALTSLTGALGVASWAGLTVLPYSPLEIRQLVASLIVVSLLMVIFERSRAQFEQEVVSIRELKELRRRFSHVQRALNESIAGILVVDRGGLITFVNKAWISMMAYEDSNELLRTELSSIVDDGERKRLKEITTGVRDGRDYVGEIAFRDQTGKRIVVWARIQAALSKGRKFDGFVLTGRDITEQKQQEARNQAILDALPDLYFHMDREGTYLDYHADRGSDLYVPPDQLLGKKLADVLPADVAEKGMNALKQALDTKKVVALEYRLPIDGDERYFEAHIAPLGSDEVVAVVRDVTENERSVAQMQARTRELERINAVMVDRELKMKELKKELARLKTQPGG